jgi:Ca2+-binding RTX toxin-like protein
MRANLVISALVFTALALPAGAGATTVTMEREVIGGPPTYDYTPRKLAIVGESGDDDLVINGSLQEWRVRDDTHPISAGGLCQAAGEHEAVCPMGNNGVEARVSLLDGNDRLTLEGLTRSGSPVVEGGPGNDRVQGGPDGDSTLTFFGDDGDDRLDGGPGDERLLGGNGYDTLHGGDGNDTFEQSHGGTEGANLVDGGPGQDSISFWDRRTLISVDLDGGSDTFGDSLSSIENVDGVDAAYGNDEDNTISSWRTLVGRGGNDHLVGTFTSTQYDAGAGDDFIETRGGRPDVQCGPGADAVNGVSFETLVAPDCELVDSTAGFARVRRQPVSFSGASGTATFTVPCTALQAGDKWCRASALVRGIARPVRRRAWIRAGFGAQATVTVPLPADVQRVLARGGVPTIYQLVDAQTRRRRTSGSLHPAFETGYRTPLVDPPSG